ncbi:MAG: sensor domain-containing diguanylate cyclase [Thermodesulfobacteriota bacterium]
MMDFDFNNLMENIQDGLYFVDPDRRIIYWNKAAERITGFASREVLGMHCWDDILMHVNDQGETLCLGNCPLARTIEDGANRAAELFLHHKDGHRVPVWVRVTPLRNRQGDIIGSAEFFSDTSPQDVMRSKIEELERLAFLDTLTQLANRRYAELELQRRFAEKERDGLAFGVILLDIDHFKQVNDTHGHDAGDLVLKTVSKTLAVNTRPFDLFGRWGGEEFIGVFRNVDAPALRHIGERTRALVEKTRIKVDGKLLHVTVSLGATLAGSPDDPLALLKRADTLLYQSKKGGRNRLTMDAQDK